MNDRLAAIIGTFVIQIAALQAELAEAKAEIERLKSSEERSPPQGQR